MHTGRTTAGIAKPINRGTQTTIKGFFRAVMVHARLQGEIKHQTKSDGLLWLQLQREAHTLLINGINWPRDPHHRAARAIIKSVVDSLQAIGGQATDGASTMGALIAPDLENIAKISVKQQPYRHTQRGLCVAGKTDLLQKGCGRKNRTTLQMNGAILVAEMAHMDPHLTALSRAQHIGRMVPKQKLKSADMAHPAIKDS